MFVRLVLIKIRSDVDYFKIFLVHTSCSSDNPLCIYLSIRLYCFYKLKNIFLWPTDYKYKKKVCGKTINEEMQHYSNNFKNISININENKNILKQGQINDTAN